MSATCCRSQLLTRGRWPWIPCVGGLFRESMSQFGAEIMAEETGLCVLCPNDRETYSASEETYIPRTASMPYSMLPLWEFVGRLMGVAIRTQTPIPLSFPSIIWKPLVRALLPLGHLCVMEACTRSLTHTY